MRLAYHKLALWTLLVAVLSGCATRALNNSDVPATPNDIIAAAIVDLDAVAEPAAAAYTCSQTPGCLGATITKEQANELGGRLTEAYSLLVEARRLQVLGDWSQAEGQVARARVILAAVRALALQYGVTVKKTEE
jgi:hypothetical protein